MSFFCGMKCCLREENALLFSLLKVQFMLAEPGSLVAHAVNMREYSRRTSDVQGDERALTSDEGMGLRGHRFSLVILLECKGVKLPHSRGR
jgi:hypothetical protein